MSSLKVEEGNSSYGFATKSDVQEIMLIINGIKQEISGLKAKAATRQKKKI